MAILQDDLKKRAILLEWIAGRLHGFDAACEKFLHLGLGRTVGLQVSIVAYLLLMKSVHFDKT